MRFGKEAVRLLASSSNGINNPLRRHKSDIGGERDDAPNERGEEGSDDAALLLGGLDLVGNHRIHRVRYRAHFTVVRLNELCEERPFVTRVHSYGGKVRVRETHEKQPVLTMIPFHEAHLKGKKGV